MSLLGQLPPPLTGRLERIRTICHDELASQHAALSGIVSDLDRYQGKMLRPTLLLLTAEAVGDVQPEHETLAAIIELLHLSTLIHDDVLDVAETRRGQPALQRLHGNEAAVLVGDYVFSTAYRMCSELDDLRAARIIGRAANRIVEGELLQVTMRGRWDLTLDDYYAIIDGKTAELIAIAARLGAEWAGADHGLAEQLTSYGRHCGMAFQIVDDVLDVTGNRSKLGKPVGRDVEMGKLTLPVLLYLQDASESDRRQMVGWLESGDAALDRIRKVLEDADAIEAAMDHARSHVHRAIDALSALPLSPAKEALVASAEFIVQRQV